MNRSNRSWLVRTTFFATLALAALAILPSRAQAQSSSFSYYNPRTGMQYSQGYSLQGRNFSNYWSYGPPSSYSSRGYRGTNYSSAPRYAAPSYNRQSYGSLPSNRRGYCR